MNEGVCLLKWFIEVNHPNMGENIIYSIPRGSTDPNTPNVKEGRERRERDKIDEVLC